MKQIVFYAVIQLPFNTLKRCRCGVAFRLLEIFFLLEYGIHKTEYRKSLLVSSNKQCCYRVCEVGIYIYRQYWICIFVLWKCMLFIMATALHKMNVSKVGTAHLPCMDPFLSPSLVNFVFQNKRSAPVRQWHIINYTISGFFRDLIAPLSNSMLILKWDVI